MTRDRRTRRNRSTLRNFFSQGAMPSAEEFADLIESSVNQIDDGFDKTDEDGLKVWSTGDSPNLFSFYRGSPTEIQPVWRVGYDGEENRLLYRREQQGRQHRDDDAVLAISPDGKVGINSREPDVHLDVNGVVRSTARLGASDPGQSPVPADGSWYDITPTLTGCAAIEVMAGVGEKGTGRYAMLRAVAINAFNPDTWFFGMIGGRKKRIRCDHAYYNSRRDRLQLRWDGQGDSYRLQLRTRCRYGADIRARFYLTHLWVDPVMSGSSPEGEPFAKVDRFSSLGRNDDHGDESGG